MLVALALRADWNPWPLLGALMTVAAFWGLGPKAVDAAKAAFQPSQMDLNTYLEKRFFNDPCLILSGGRNHPDDFEEGTEVKFQEVRRYFVPHDGSDKDGTYQRVNPLSLPMWLRLALLPDLVGLNLNRERYWRLRWRICWSFKDQKSHYGRYDMPETQFHFEPLGAAPDLLRWVKVYPQIKALLGFDVQFRFDPWTGEVVLIVVEAGDVRAGQFAELPPALLLAGLPEEATLTEADMLPYEPLPFVPETYREDGSGGHLAKGYLYLGQPFLDRNALGHWLKIDDLNNTLVMGTAGFGKSVFLNQVLQGVLHNPERFDQALLVDLKGGVELWPYKRLSKSVEVVKDIKELGPWISGLVATVEDRLEMMRERGERMWPGAKTLLIIDEYAQIQLAPEITKEERQYKQVLLADLNKLSMLGRAAGVVIVAQLQKGTTDVMDSSFRANLANQVCFKVPNKLTAASMFGSTDELAVDPVKLPKGRFVFYDATNGETHYLQARMPGPVG